MASLAASVAGEVLIVADEFPAMEVLAKSLKQEENIGSTIVGQTNMPASLAKYQAVIVYIHKALKAEPEKAFIKYANDGGKLVLLHHSISSGKKTNELWYGFLGVDLMKKDVNEGGYKWTEGIDMQVVNLAPEHFITTHQVKYESQVPYKSEAATAEKTLPGFDLHDSEVYINHTYAGPRTILLGFKYKDATGKVWMQDRSAWYKPAGKGMVIYIQPGHSVREFEHPTYARIVVNAVIFKP